MKVWLLKWHFCPKYGLSLQDKGIWYSSTVFINDQSISNVFGTKVLEMAVNSLKCSAEISSDGRVVQMRVVQMGVVQLCSCAVVQMGELCRTKSRRSTRYVGLSSPASPAAQHVSPDCLTDPQKLYRSGNFQIFREFWTGGDFSFSSRNYFKISFSRSIRLRSEADCSVMSLEESYVHILLAFLVFFHIDTTYIKWE